jgi:serine/threonine protein phosphatase 1
MKAKQWTVGDIHGCLNTLRKLIEEKLLPSLNDQIFFLGDYIDRGPNSKGVIDYLIKLKSLGFQVCTLKGNHEDVLLNLYLHESGKIKLPDYFELKKGWLHHGGDATLKSFGVTQITQIPEKYIDWLQNLWYYKVTGDFILVHAGFNFELNNPFRDKPAMLWAKEYEVKSQKVGYRTIVHGHVPQTLSQIREDVDTTNCYSIDNGCVYQNRSGMGNLVALELNSKMLALQSNTDFAKSAVRYFAVA